MPVTVACPATTANLGPGFDAVGLALDLANRFRIEEAPAGFTLEADGPYAARLSGDGRDGPLVRAYQGARAALGLPPAPGLRVRMTLQVPPGRGLGSSATAVAAGLLAAEALAGRSLPEEERLALATELEGHPDNVVPCLLGGLCVAVREPSGRVRVGRATPRLPALVVAVPETLELATEAMRRALPAEVSHADATFNAGRAALLLFALLQERADLLPSALEDRLHQPYRGARIPGYAQVRAAAEQAGAHGLVISGSGPTLLALAPEARAEAVAAAMREAWQAAGVAAWARRVEPQPRGAAVVAEEA